MTLRFETCDDCQPCPGCGVKFCTHHHAVPCLCAMRCAECCTCEGEAA